MNLVVIGGGMIQDIGGFIASTFYRGINWIYVPTTLLAQSDSCIGAKTSLNFFGFKNIIGTFYPPSEVYICSKFLKTLSDENLKSGLGEIVKIQLVNSSPKKLKTLLKIIKSPIFNRSQQLNKLIYKSLLIKKKYIEIDEFDKGVRNFLNYGHTLGHALETLSNFKIAHGIAIIVGIAFANTISLKRNLIEKQLFDFQFENLFLPIIKNANFENEYFNKKKLLTIVKSSKNNVSQNLTFIIPDKNLQLVKIKDITEKEFSDCINYLKNIIPISKSI